MGGEPGRVREPSGPPRERRDVPSAHFIPADVENVIGRVVVPAGTAGIKGNCAQQVGCAGKGCRALNVGIRSARGPYWRSVPFCMRGVSDSPAHVGPLTVPLGTVAWRVNSVGSASRADPRGNGAMSLPRTSYPPMSRMSLAVLLCRSERRGSRVIVRSGVGCAGRGCRALNVGIRSARGPYWGSRIVSG